MVEARMRGDREKSRDIARSALASTAHRGVRREHQSLVQSRRSRETAHVRRLAVLADSDDLDEPAGRPRRDRTAWKALVEHRREHDKLGPLRRWAQQMIERTPDLAAGDDRFRREWFRRALGSGVAGRHALSHIEDMIRSPNRLR